MRTLRKREGATLGEIEAAYRAGFAGFRRVAAAILGDRDAALDAVQDAFGSAIRHRSRYDRRGPLEGWLWRIVVNTARDHARSTRAGTNMPLPSANGHAPSADSALAVAVAALPERQRLAVFLRYYADLDYAGIAEALEVRPGTVAATLNAAHATLRRTLQEVPR